MAEWLLEILSEEIPSRMQKGAMEQLKTLAESKLQEKSLSFEKVQTFVTPRRLTLVVQGLPHQTTDRLEEKKGPRLDAPQTAIDGFLKTAGVSREECGIKDTPKGQFLFVTKKEAGSPTQEALSDIAISILASFRWPKSMRWGSLATTWVRPIQSFLSIFEREIVPFSYAGIDASNTTKGHRFLASKPFTVTNFQDYEKKLRDHFVMLDWQERRVLIQKGILQIAKDLKPLEDESLLDEVAGLVEWPVPLKGKVDGHFMTLPLEVITTPMRVHQRYFPLFDFQGNLAPVFGLIANVDSCNQGKTIVTGNERVLRARLADAQFFWKQDQKQPLDHFNISLKTRLFHQHLGSLFGKVERLVKLSSRIAQKLEIDSKTVARAAFLSKADLASQMVNEFPELQGIMGRYYAQNQGEPLDVARAIEEHYWPKASGGTLPTAAPSLILAIADRLDTLIGFFALGISPTGSKDPFALRRTGLGLIALLLNPHFSLSITELLSWAYDCYSWTELNPPVLKTKKETISHVWQFLLERFKFFLRDGQGSPYDHVEAVLGIARENPTFSDLSLRVKALDQLMEGKDGQNLLAAYKRASNILKIEEEKDQQRYEGQVSADYLTVSEERALFTNLSEKSPYIQQLVEKGHFVQAVQDLATLRPFVDQFFDKVVVNTEDESLRKNRLHLLAFLRQTLHQVADFSKIEG